MDYFFVIVIALVVGVYFYFVQTQEEWNISIININTNSEPEEQCYRYMILGNKEEYCATCSDDICDSGGYARLQDLQLMVLVLQIVGFCTVRRIVEQIVIQT